MQYQHNLGGSGANQFAGTHQPGQQYRYQAQEEKKGWWSKVLGSSEREKADAIMRDFYQQVDRTDHHVRDQGQRVTVLETATTTLLESQANAQKRVQALANGITQQEELLAQRSAKVYAPLQFNSHN